MQQHEIRVDCKLCRINPCPFDMRMITSTRLIDVDDVVVDGCKSSCAGKAAHGDKDQKADPVKDNLTTGRTKTAAVGFDEGNT